MKKYSTDTKFQILPPIIPEINDFESSQEQVPKSIDIYWMLFAAKNIYSLTELYQLKVKIVFESYSLTQTSKLKFIDKTICELQNRFEICE
jgi:hypothetical protein